MQEVLLKQLDLAEELEFFLTHPSCYLFRLPAAERIGDSENWEWGEGAPAPTWGPESNCAQLQSQFPRGDV